MRAAISVNGAPSATVLPGDALEWKVSVTNTSQTTIDGASLAAILRHDYEPLFQIATLTSEPRVTTGASARPALPGIGDGSLHSEALLWMGALEPGESATISYRARVLPEADRRADDVALTAIALVTNPDQARAALSGPSVGTARVHIAAPHQSESTAKGRQLPLMGVTLAPTMTMAFALVLAGALLLVARRGTSAPPGSPRHRSA